MTLYLIGIGLNDEKDITVKGLEIVKKSRFVFLENYTSLLTDAKKEDLEKFYGKKITLADREMVEKRSDEILEKAKKNDVSFLVIGDVFSATTHIDIYLRAKKKNIEIVVIFNAGIFNVIGITGLQLYKFGKTTSIVFPEKNYFPESCYDVIKMNKENGLHTLCLLDIKTEKNEFMTIRDAISILLKIEEKRKEKVFDKNTLCVGCARLGKDNFIRFGEAEKLLNTNFGKPPHCLIVPGELHFLEKEFLETL